MSIQNHVTPFHIGMRNFKTALAATLVALIYLPFHRNPTFACIGAVFGMGYDMSSSWLNGGNRLFGTIFGGLIGMALFSIYIQFYPEGGFEPLMLLLLFVGIILLITVSQIFHWPGAIQPGGVMLCIVLFNQPVDTYIAYSINRIIDTIEVDDCMMLLNNMIDCGESVLVEGSQGCDLDINYGLNYPHTTSRQCHAGQLVADCGISPRLVDDIIMIMRPYPIRISNQTNIGLEISSGDYDGAEELTWDIIKERCGAPDDVQFGEMTTVTKKMRRVFEMNWDRLRYVTTLNRPTQIALNFAQYIDYGALGCKKWSELPQKVKDFIARVEDVTNVKVTLIGTGAANDEIIDRR